MSRLNVSLRRLEKRVTEAELLVGIASNASASLTTYRAFSASQLEGVYELGLLKLVIAGELFLEESLSLYAIGERTRTGWRPRRRRRLDVTHAVMLDMFRGDQEFVGWVDAGVVIKRADRWLVDGGPFRTALSATSRPLSFFRQMRNVIAHESDSAQAKYIAAVRALYGHVPPRCEPGAQLRQPPPPGIPNLNGATLFSAALGVYRFIGTQIVR